MQEDVDVKMLDFGSVYQVMYRGKEAVRVLKNGKAAVLDDVIGEMIKKVGGD